MCAWQSRAQGGFAAANADLLFGFESHDGVPGAIDEQIDAAALTQTLDAVTGRRARTFAAWARDHAHQFR